MGTGAKLRKFQADKDLELFAVSPADAAAEAVSNRDNQVYFGKGAISLREGEHIKTPTNHPQAAQPSPLPRQSYFMSCQTRGTACSMHACLPSS
jgi:hypothetical protein